MEVGVHGASGVRVVPNVMVDMREELVCVTTHLLLLVAKSVLDQLLKRVPVTPKNVLVSEVFSRDLCLPC